MPLTPGTRLGLYPIVAPLRAGGDHPHICTLFDVGCEATLEVVLGWPKLLEKR